MYRQIFQKIKNSENNQTNFPKIENFRKCANEFSKKIENYVKRTDKFIKKIKIRKIFRQIFVKIENFGKCADNFS